MGSEKVEMKRIENRVGQQMTFSNCRGGLLKKARELGVDVGVVVFPERGRLFEYPSPPARFSNISHSLDHFVSTSLTTYAEEDMSSLTTMDVLDELEQQLESAFSKVRAIKDELLINLTHELQIKINGNRGDQFQAARQQMGRGKMEMKRIENRESRLVTFTERRKDLLKKAHQLAMLCDMDVGGGVFSERGRLFERSSPPASLTDLIRRYEAITNTELLQGTQTHCTDHQQQMTGWLRHECKQLEASLMAYTAEDLSSFAAINELERHLESALSKARARKNELPPPPPYLVNVKPKSARSMKSAASIVLTFVLLAVLAVPLAAAPVGGSDRAPAPVPPPDTAPPDYLTARTSNKSFFSPIIYGNIFWGICVFVGLGILYAIWRSEHGQDPVPPPIAQVELPPLQDEEAAAAAATAIAKVRSSLFTLEEQGDVTEKDCTLCLAEYEEGEDLAIMQCGHRYHRACLMKWFHNKANCPLCRASV